MRMRTVLIACAGLLAALVLVLVVFLATFDANKYKPLIEAKAREATGRVLSIKGPIHLSLTPRPTLVVEGLSFANMPGGARPDMVTAKRVEIALDFFPLLSGQVSVAKIGLSGADLLIETDRNGRGNWQFADAAAPAPGAAPAAPASPPSAAGKPAASPLSVRAIQITDSSVAYRTDATGKEKTLSIGRLLIEPGSSTIPIEVAGALDNVPFELKGSVGGGALAGLPHFPVTLNGRLLGFDVALDGELGQSLKAKITAGDLKPLATALGTSLPDLGAIKIDTTLSGPLTAPVLDPLTLGIGDNVLQGKLAVKLGGPRPAISATLQSQRIALGGGKPAAAPTPAGGAAKPAAGERQPLFSPAPLPFDALQSLDLDARIEISALSLGGLALDGVSATVTLANGLLTAKPVAAGLAGGHMTLDATLDGPHKSLSLDAIGQQIATDQLLKELGMTAYLADKADVSTKLTGHGDSAHAIASSLGGDVSLTLGPGTIAGKALQGAVGDAVKVLSAGGDATKLTCGVVKLQITNGVAHPNPLVVQTDAAMVNGTGIIDLGRETVDLKMTPRITSQALAGIAVPFRVSGPLTAPGVEPDAAGLAEGAAGAAAAIASGGLVPLAGLLAGSAANAAPAGGGCGAQPAAATSPAAGAAPKPASPAPTTGGGLLNGLNRALGR